MNTRKLLVVAMAGVLLSIPVVVAHAQEADRPSDIDLFVAGIDIITDFEVGGDLIGLDERANGAGQSMRAEDGEATPMPLLLPAVQSAREAAR